MHSYKAHVVSEMKTQQTLTCKIVPPKEMVSGLGASLKKIDENIAQEDKEVYKTSETCRDQVENWLSDIP